jgi:ubiquitin-conjugating enzyme E2 T
MAQVARIKRELEMLALDPGPGVSAWPLEDNMMNLEAQIQGPQDSPYSEGTYSLSVQITDRYPFEPPRVRFLTPIYHPNIDSDGRICLDTLKMQPQGTWSPSVNINTLLLTIRMLMQTPNADDGLVPEITEEYKRDVATWRRKALEHTRKNAIPKPPMADPAPLPAPPLEGSILGKRQRPESQPSPTTGQDLGKGQVGGEEADDEEEEEGIGGEEDDEDEDEGFYVK